MRGASTSERERESARDGEKLVRLISEYDALRGEGITEARMMAWILQLESSEIPGALDFLMERERSEYGDELDGNDREIGGEMLALLARWYELDGEGVITWVRGQKEWTKEDTLKAEILMICDGYHRDPRRGFELCLDWIEQGRQGDGPGSTGRLPGEADFRDVILYQVGRWGSDPKAMLEQVDFDGELRATFYVSMSGGGLRGSSRLNAGGMGFPYTPSKSSDYSSNPAMRAFARGLADSGRSSLLREMVGGLEGGAREAFEAVITDSLEGQGWQAVKAEIDRGNIGASFYEAKEVLNELAKLDPREALDWYLSLPESQDLSREEMIQSAVVESDVFRIDNVNADPEDPFAARLILDFEKAERVLMELENAGEPVGEAWLGLVNEILGRGLEEELGRTLLKLRPAQRSKLEEGVLDRVTTRESFRLRGEDLEFFSTGSYGEDSARELGLMNEARERIEARNVEARAKLREILEKMEASGGQ